MKKIIYNQSVTKHTASNTTLDLTINRGVPYFWYVVSKSNKSTTTAKSDIWKFYNADEGVTEYVLFSAEIVGPLYNETVTVSNGKTTLNWTGSDVDGDIESYEVFFGEANPPGSFQQIFNDVPVSSGKIYHWKVKTMDAEGNASMYDMFNFIVN